MNKEFKYEFYLIAIAFVLAACIVVFIALKSPPLTSPNISPIETTSAATAPITAAAATQIETNSTTAKISVKPKTTANEPTSFAGKVNVNTATKEELMILKGIGEVTAEKIIEYRSVNGNFTGENDLLNVSGIGEKKLAAIKDYISF